jgi:hypothetical protein
MMMDVDPRGDASDFDERVSDEPPPKPKRKPAAKAPKTTTKKPPAKGKGKKVIAVSRRD